MNLLEVDKDESVVDSNVSDKEEEKSYDNGEGSKVLEWRASTLAKNGVELIVHTRQRSSGFVMSRSRSCPNMRDKCKSECDPKQESFLEMMILKKIKQHEKGTDDSKTQRRKQMMTQQIEMMHMNSLDISSVTPFKEKYDGELKPLRKRDCPRMVKRYSSSDLKGLKKALGSGDVNSGSINTTSQVGSNSSGHDNADASSTKRSLTSSMCRSLSCPNLGKLVVAVENNSITQERGTEKIMNVQNSVSTFNQHLRKKKMSRKGTVYFYQYRHDETNPNGKDCNNVNATGAVKGWIVC